MNETTTQELKDIVAELGLTFYVDNPKYIDDMSPELKAAIKDKEGFKKFLKKDREFWNKRTLDQVSEYFDKRFSEIKNEQ